MSSPSSSGFVIIGQCPDCITFVGTHKFALTMRHLLILFVKVAAIRQHSFPFGNESLTYSISIRNEHEQSTPPKPVVA